MAASLPAPLPSSGTLTAMMDIPFTPNVSKPDPLSHLPPDMNSPPSPPPIEGYFSDHLSKSDAHSVYNLNPPEEASSSPDNCASLGPISFLPTGEGMYDATGIVSPQLDMQMQIPCPEPEIINGVIDYAPSPNGYESEPSYDSEYLPPIGMDHNDSMSMSNEWHSPSVLAMSQWLMMQRQKPKTHSSNSSSDEHPVFVNPKQYHAIVRRRFKRARYEAKRRLTRRSKSYLHESRHRHACRRPRGAGGKFLPKTGPSKQKKRKIQNGKGINVDETQKKSGQKKKPAKLVEKEIWKEQEQIIKQVVKIEPKADLYDYSDISFENCARLSNLSQIQPPTAMLGVIAGRVAHLSHESGAYQQSQHPYAANSHQVHNLSFSNIRDHGVVHGVSQSNAHSGTHRGTHSGTHSSAHSSTHGRPSLQSAQQSHQNLQQSQSSSQDFLYSLKDSQSHFQPCHAVVDINLAGLPISAQVLSHSTPDTLAPSLPLPMSSPNCTNSLPSTDISYEHKQGALGVITSATGSCMEVSL